MSATEKETETPRFDHNIRQQATLLVDAIKDIEGDAERILAAMEVLEEYEKFQPKRRDPYHDWSISRPIFPTDRPVHTFPGDGTRFDYIEVQGPPYGSVTCIGAVN